MKNTCQRISLIVIFLLIFSLILPASFPSLIKKVAAQENEPIPVYISHQYENPPERVELENGGYKLIYKNIDGQVFREQEYVLGVLVRDKTISTAYPSGQEASVNVIDFGMAGGQFGSVIKWQMIFYDKRGVPLRRSNLRRDKDGNVFVDEDGNLLIEVERWNQRDRKWEPLPDISQAAPGYKAATTVANGLQTTTFNTPQGNISVNLTDDLAAGDTLSGTVSVQPEGQTPQEQAVNTGELGGYVVELEKQETDTQTDSQTSKPFKWVIPAVTTGITALVLKDKKGKEVARTPIPVLPVPFEEQPEEFQLPEIGQQSKPVEIKGNFDGDFSTTRLKIGGEKIQTLAESPRKTVARNTGKKLGLTDIEIEEQGKTVKGQFRNIGIRLSAPKLDLMKGEQTTLLVKVFGLEGIKKAVPLVVENKSPSIIKMGGGELQKINIMPDQVKDSTYTMERPLTGIRRGSFNITGTVITDGQNENQSPDLISSSPEVLRPGEWIQEI